MYDQTNYLTVGIFILIGTILLVAVGFWVGGSGQSVPMSKYTIVFERDVNGLSVGGPVRFMGVDVGEVTSIRLHETQQTAIEVRIDIASSTPVNHGTFASLGYQGITGVAFINLAQDAGEHAEFTGAASMDKPSIKTRDVGFSALLNSSPEVLAQINNVLEDVRLVLGAENRGVATQILKNVEQITGALAEQRGELAAVPSHVNKSLIKFQDTLETGADLARDSRPDLLATLLNLRQTSTKLSSVTEQLEHWMVENEGAIDSFLADGVGGTPALISDIQSAVRELKKLGATLRDDPSRIVFKPRLEPVVVAQ